MSKAYRVRSLGWYHRGCFFEAIKPVDATARGLPLEELAEGIPEGEYCVGCSKTCAQVEKVEQEVWKKPS